jgi:hypothetical protein
MVKTSKQISTILLACVIITAIAVAGIVIAVVSISWTQNLTVPASQATVAVSNGVSWLPVSGNPDLSQYWTWASPSWTLLIQITNTGSATFTPTVTPAGLTGTFTTSTLTSLAPTASETVTLTYTPTSAIAGSNSGGAFSITVGQA